MILESGLMGQRKFGDMMFAVFAANTVLANGKIGGSLNMVFRAGEPAAGAAAAV